MKTLLFIFLLFALTVQGQKKYTVSRFEETATSVFVCLNSKVTPAYVEHFFTSAEMATVKDRKATIERLVAELELKDEMYKPPLTVTYKEREANLQVLDTVNIRKEKVKLRLAAKLKADSVLLSKPTEIRTQLP
jgi:hypothetical protein